MDPSMKDDFDAMTARVTAAVTAAVAETVKAVVHTALVDTNANIIELTSGKPDLEKSSAVPTASELVTAQLAATRQDKLPVDLTGAKEVVYELVMGPPTICSMDCSGSDIGAPAPTTQAMPPRLLQAAAPALTHELMVLRPMPWPSFECSQFASDASPSGASQDDRPVGTINLSVASDINVSTASPPTGSPVWPSSNTGTSNSAPPSTHGDAHEMFEPMSELFDKSEDATAAMKEHKDAQEFMRAQCLVFLPFAKIHYELWRPPDRAYSWVCMVCQSLPWGRMTLLVFLNPWPPPIYQTMEESNPIVMHISTISVGDCCSALSFALHTTSSYVVLYPQVLSEMRLLYFELPGIGMSWTYLQLIGASGRLFPALESVATSIVLLSRETDEVQPWAYPFYMENLFLICPCSRPTSLQSRSSLKLGVSLATLISLHYVILAVEGATGCLQSLQPKPPWLSIVPATLIQVALKVEKQGVHSLVGASSLQSARTKLFDGAIPKLLDMSQASQESIMVNAMAPPYTRVYKSFSLLEQEYGKIARGVQNLAEQQKGRSKTVWTWFSPATTTTFETRPSQLRGLCQHREQGDSFSEFSLLPLFRLPLVTELHLWDPGGWEFFESFTQAEAKRRRRTKAPSHFFDIVHVHLDHGCCRKGNHCDSSNTEECLVPWDSGSNSTASAQVALEFMNQVYKLHGLPDMIVSNRYPIFSSKFWQSLFTLIGTQLNLSTANHPQSDDQMERSNQCREIYLRCFVHTCPKQWFQWLTLDELWYHTSYHSTLGHSPFKVMYGHEPEHLGIDTVDVCSVPDLQAWLQGRSAMNELLTQQLNTANQRLKTQADKGCTDHSFAHRDMIFLKLQPHAQIPWRLAQIISSLLVTMVHIKFLLALVLWHIVWSCHLLLKCIRSFTSQLRRAIPPYNKLPRERTPVEYLTRKRRLIHVLSEDKRL